MCGSNLLCESSIGYAPSLSQETAWTKAAAGGPLDPAKETCSRVTPRGFPSRSRRAACLTSTPLRRTLERNIVEVTESWHGAETAFDIIRLAGQSN
jgi:hypothetical protein